MSSNYQELLNKINEFKQKFYLNKLLRGLIYASSLILALFLVLFLSVYFARPTVGVKTFLFIFFILSSLTAVITLVILPLLSYLKLGRMLSTEEAANFIGSHFSSVRDKLLNTLQLHALADLSPEGNALVMAGIDQKILELRPVPFARAIDLGENKKYIRYIMAPLGCIILIGILAPAILREGSYSFIKYDQEVLPPAPFKFELSNRRLVAVQGDDLTLNLKLQGDQLPQDVYVEDGQNVYKLEKVNTSSFKYTFQNIQKSRAIRFSGGGFNSETHRIQVIPRPSVLNIQAVLNYPAYLKRPSQKIENASDLLIPEGTTVRWELTSENSDALTFLLGNSRKQLSITGGSSSFAARIKEPGNYTVIAQNDLVEHPDSIRHQIQVIKDQFPSISVREIADSVSSKALYFSGNVTDDHGISSIVFQYNVMKDGKADRSIRKRLPIDLKNTSVSWFHLWKLGGSEIKPGETVEYFFEVSDNDGVNGPKTSRSTIFTFNSLTKTQLAEKINSGSNKLKDKLQEAIKLANTVEKESKKVADLMLDKKQLTYEDKKQIEQLLDKRKQLEESIKDIRDLNEKNNLEKKENNTLTEELVEKQKQIDNLLNNVLDEKTKELLKQLEKMIQENNKDQTQQELSKMQMDNKSLKKELDRILELYKQLEFEQRLQNDIDRLKQLAKEQADLAKQSLERSTTPEQLARKQEQLSKEFNDLKKELDALQEKNEQLERPNQFKSPDEESKKIRDQQQNSKENLQQNKKKDASDNQKNAASEMEKMAQKLDEMQQQGEDAEAKVNAEELRKLLAKLVSTSFEQEKTMLTLRRMAPTDPQYIPNVQKQRSIKDNMQTIADSLYALSKRVPQIETVVNSEMQTINTNIEKSLTELGERRTGEANKHQQYTMTAVNNLALMLNEALEQLQNMQKNSKSGKGKQGVKQLQQMQQQLNKNMQNAKQQLEQSGNKGSVPKGQMSEQFAKMAQQQQMIREALQKINREENKDGKGGLGNLNETISEMKKTENDLVNKRLNQEMISRQKDILTKLLEAENSQRQQDEDSQRQAKAGLEFPPSYKKLLEQFNKEQRSETELLQKLPPNLNQYYKERITDYYKKLNGVK